MSYILPNRQIITLHAANMADVHGFLQSLITCNMEHMASQPALLGALLTPQGKFVADFILSRLDDTTLAMETDSASVEELLQLLKRYKLRKPITITHDTSLAVGWYPQLDATINAYPDPRHHTLGMRSIAARSELEALVDGTEQHLRTRIQHGIPEGRADALAGESLLLELHYDALGAIDFTKGCYVGQEVTARSKHRGTMHKSLHILHANSALPTTDTPLLQEGDKQVGIVRSVHDNMGLAIIRHKLLSDAPLYAGNICVTAHVPPWLAG